MSLSPSNRYAIAWELHKTALAEVASAAANLFDGDASAAVENLELLRGLLHRQVDDLIDAEQVRRPSATRPVLRVPRYREPRP